jgi:predicted pyridoxine 5'-phosphate oxidase superfamily flavin-nucleotide-binding protein
MDSAMPGPQAARATTGERMMQNLLGTRQRAERFYEQQVIDHLSEPMRRFIGRQNMMFLATSDADGACDSTLRAGPAGFVVVLDERRLAWPEYRGNGVMASRGNIIENPHVGLLFVDFVGDVIGLHVNGCAAVVDDAVLRVELDGLPVDPVPGRQPEQWVVAHVEEAYIHCAKYIPRLYVEPGDPRRPSHPPQTRKSDFFALNATEKAGRVPTSPATSSAGWRRQLLRILLLQLRQKW